MRFSRNAMRIFLSILGIILSIAMLKYRQQVGDTVGEAEWMKKIGGIYNFIILLALFFLIWSIASLTNTTQILFAPIRWVLPGL